MTTADFRSLMVEAHVDRHGLAVALGVSPRAVQSWELGERRIPTYAIEGLRRLAGENVVTKAVERDLLEALTRERRRRVELEVQVRQTRHLVRRGRRLADHELAVSRFCRSCEPGGTCHDGRCPLRPVSPLPLA